MDMFPEFQKKDFSILTDFHANPLSKGGESFDLDSEDLEIEKAFSSEKKAFSEYMKTALSDEEDGDLNHVALRFISAWTKHETFLMMNGRQKGLTKPKSIQDAFTTLKQKHQRLVSIFKKIWSDEEKSLTTQEEAFLVSLLKCDAENFKEFITTCSLYDMCFYNQNKQVIQTAMDEFKKDIPFFVEWLNKENQLLSMIIENDDKKSPQVLKGINHIAQNFVFAEAVLKNIPPECWTNEIVLALGRWVVSDKTSVSYVRDFARKLEKCPSDKIADYFSLLSELTEIKTNNFKDFSYAGVFSLLSSFKEEKAIREAILFYEKCGDSLYQQKSKDFTYEEWKKIAPFLSKTKVGMNQLINASLDQNNSLVWHLYRKNDLKKEDLERILYMAMMNDRRDFLMMNKPLHFSNEFPCYEELKQFFKEKSSAQGTRFLRSFSWDGVSVEQKCKLLNDFVSSRAINFHFLEKFNLFNHWAKNSSGHEILSYCYGQNVDTEPALRIPEADLRKLFSKQDEQGRTPWHYICQQKDKSFFNRRLTELSKSFIDACLIPDESGKTPLDYASSDSKFIKKISEKNPEIGKKLALAGISTEYVPAKKEAKPVMGKLTPVKLAPAIPEEKITSVSDEKQQERIEKAMFSSLQDHQNLILKGAGRIFGLTNGVLKEIQSDEPYRQDVLEHLQQFASTPFGGNFVVGNATRWKVFEGADGIYEMSISPKNGHSQSMPRIYFKKFLFKKTGNTFAITNRKETENPQAMWVAVKKGDKKSQSKDGKRALAVRFKNDGLQVSGPVNFNDLNWHYLDLTVPEIPQKQPIIPQNGGR